jgi:hypothetical protein
MAGGAMHCATRAVGIDGNREFEELTVRMVLIIGCVAAALLGGAALYARGAAAPACDSDGVQGEVYRLLHEQSHLEGIFLHDFRPISGGLFSDTRDCEAEVAEIKGNVSAADMPWRHLHYRIVRSDDPDHPAVTVDLGSATAFVATPEQTLWTRLVAHF